MTNKVYKDLIEAVRGQKLFDFLCNYGYRLTHTEITRLFLDYIFENERYISDTRLNEMYDDLLEDIEERFKGNEEG